MGRGDEDKVSHTVMVKDNFYAVFSNDQNEIETKNKSPKVYFSRGTYHYFKTEVERENFINYLKTDFARFCLILRFSPVFVQPTKNRRFGSPSFSPRGNTVAGVPEVRYALFVCAVVFRTVFCVFVSTASFQLLLEKY